MAGAITLRPGPKLDWFTDELQQKLIAAVATGLKPMWIARLHFVAPKALVGILEMGCRPDAVDPFKRFARRWIQAEAQLMQDKVIEWKDGSPSAFNFLKERWPKVWGPDAEPDYQAAEVTVTNEQELAQFEAILADPAAFGLLELFAKHRRLRADGT